jgi:hypothetical protein
VDRGTHGITGAEIVAEPAIQVAPQRGRHPHVDAPAPVPWQAVRRGLTEALAPVW